jgi:hypothetical protein
VSASTTRIAASSTGPASGRPALGGGVALPAAASSGGRWWCGPPARPDRPRPFSSVSPLSGRVANAASPAARKASRQVVSVAAVMQSERYTISRSSPRSSRSSADVLRCRDILLPRQAPLRQPLAAAPRRPVAPGPPRNPPSHTSIADIVRLRCVSFNRGAGDRQECDRAIDVSPPVRSQSVYRGCQAPNRDSGCQRGGHHVDTTAAKRKAALRRPFLNALISLGEIGAGEGIRTLDPNLGKVVLYP